MLSLGEPVKWYNNSDQCDDCIYIAQLELIAVIWIPNRRGVLIDCIFHGKSNKGQVSLVLMLVGPLSGFI